MNDSATGSPAALDLEWDELGSLTKTVFTGNQFLYTADEERIGILPAAGAPTWRLRDLAGLVVREYRTEAPGAGVEAIFKDGFETGDVFCWSDGTAAGTYGQCNVENTKSFLHAAGYHLVTEAPDGSLTFNLPDLLGTPRRIYDETGAIVHSP